jgi:hypothetical protein
MPKRRRQNATLVFDAAMHESLRGEFDFFVANASCAERLLLRAVLIEWASAQPRAKSNTDDLPLLAAFEAVIIDHPVTVLKDHEHRELCRQAELGRRVLSIDAAKVRAIGASA